MKQSYHSNAVTNDHIRSELYSSLLPASSLAERYDISTNTVYKWRKREKAADLSS